MQPTGTTIGTAMFKDSIEFWSVGWGHGIINSPSDVDVKPTKPSLRQRFRYWRAARWDNLSFKLWDWRTNMDCRMRDWQFAAQTRAEKLWGIE